MVYLQVYRSNSNIKNQNRQHVFFLASICAETSGSIIFMLINSKFRIFRLQVLFPIHFQHCTNVRNEIWSNRKYRMYRYNQYMRMFFDSVYINIEATSAYIQFLVRLIAIVLKNHFTNSSYRCAICEGNFIENLFYKTHKMYKFTCKIFSINVLFWKSYSTQKCI